jgi:hypothetical protein
MKSITTIAAIVAAVALAGCGSSSNTSSSSHQSQTLCMVTAEGNKVCGEAAKSWCQITQRTRDAYESINGSDPDVDSTNSDCQKVEASRG